MTVCKNRFSTLSCRGSDVIQQSSESERQGEIKSQEGKKGEREGGKDRYSPRPLPLPPLTCKQASATGREGEGGYTHPFQRPMVHQGASQEQ